MTPSQMRHRIGRLPAHLPLSDRFDLEMEGGTAAIAKAWYSSQKEHWQGWLREYDGPGAYGRRTQSGRDAAFVYNHVVNPQMLVWLAEAVRIPRSRLLKARRAALAAGGRMQEMSGAIRRVIPYEILEPYLIDATTRRRPRRSGQAGTTLQLVLHREFFDAIAAGTKRVEYRRDTAYWRSRLAGRQYTNVVFRNGYLPDAPTLRVQCRGIRKGRGEFMIDLGRILEVKNYSKPK